MIPITDALDLFNCAAVGKYLVITFVGAWALRLIYHRF